MDTELNGIGLNNRVENRFKYQDKESLTLFGLSGINDFDARYYDKTVGRWWGVDALADMMPDWSPYNYVFNNPVQFIDPFGLSPTTGADGLTNDQWMQTSNPANHGSEAFGGNNITTQYRQDNWHNEARKSWNKANQRSFDELSDGESFSGENYSTTFTYGGFENDIDNIYPYFFVRKKRNDTYGPEWLSYVPVIGSGRDAYKDFQNGDYGWAVFNATMAVSDVFLLKSLIVAGGKLATKTAFKTGSHTWRATRKWLGKTGQAAAGQDVHHWALSQKMIKKYGLQAIGNQPWNLMPMPSKVFHQAVHGVGPNAFGTVGQLWYGTPTWFKTLGAYGVNSIENTTR